LTSPRLFVGFLGLRVLDLLGGRVEVLHAVGRRLAFTWAGALAVLDILVVDSHGFIDLGTESVIVAGKAQELAVVHLQEHTGDLAGQLRLLRRFRTRTLDLQVLLKIDSGLWTCQRKRTWRVAYCWRLILTIPIMTVPLVSLLAEML